LPKEKKAKVASFDKVMSHEDVEQEKCKGTALGKSLINAEKEYEKRRKK